MNKPNAGPKSPQTGWIVALVVAALALGFVLGHVVSEKGALEQPEQPPAGVFPPDIQRAFQLMNERITALEVERAEEERPADED